MSELQLIRRIAALAGRAQTNPFLVKGIGDDCAVLRPPAQTDLVFTTDFVLEGRHFNLDVHSASDVGHKALARGLSDLAAMGSKPVFCLLSLALPGYLTSRWMDEFYSGLLALANRYGMTLAGGDLSSFDKVVADVICCGHVPPGEAILRGGAKPGDRIFVTGPLGGAAQSNWTTRPEPRIDAGLALRRLATAGIDISDGLSLDLHRLCVESGTAANIDSNRIPIAPGATIEQALHGGEDYELLITARRETRFPLPLIEIGVMEDGSPGDVLLDGHLLELKGFDHFM